MRGTMINQYLENEELKSLFMKFFEIINSKRNISFEDALNQYLNWANYNLSASSVRNVKISSKHFLQYRGNITLAEVDTFFVDNFLVELSSKAPKGYRVYYRTLKAMFQKFVQWNFVSKNPFTNVKLPKFQISEKKFFEYDEFINLISKEKDIKLRLLFLLDFFTGLRLSEIVNLKWEDINFSQKYITVGSDTFQTKSRRIRKIPLNNNSIKILQLLKINYGSSKYVFSKSNSFPFTSDYISKRFKRLLRANSFEDYYTFHSIRHSTASNLAREGIALPIIQQILGHSDIKTTMIYTHTNFNDSLSAVKKLEGNRNIEGVLK